MVSQVRVLFEAPNKNDPLSWVVFVFHFGYVPNLRHRGCAKPWARAAQHAMLTVAGKTVRWTVLPLRCNHASGRRRSPYSSQVRVLFEAPKRTNRPSAVRSFFCFGWSSNLRYCVSNRRTRLLTGSATPAAGGRGSPAETSAEGRSDA